MTNSNPSSGGDGAAFTPVYLDHNATTPLDPRVADAMMGWLRRGGNPSSLHVVGRAAREAVEAARAAVAGFLGASRPEQIVFGGSGTELNNAILHTLALADEEAPGHLVVSAFEHPSVLAGAARLEQTGFAVTRLPPGGDGVVDAAAVRAALRSDTRLVALMAANNELGTVQPVAEVGEICRERGVLLLCDAVQAAGKIPVDVEALGADYVVVAGHKLNGPVGAAAAWIREGAPFEPLLVGGSQERRRRAGTENVAAIVGFGLACELAGEELEDRRRRTGLLRGRFEEAVAGSPGVVVHCSRASRLPNTSNLRIEGVRAQDLLIRLDLAGFAVSTGSACASGSVEPSPALLALGLSPEQALATLRVSFGAGNRADEVDRFVEALLREAAALQRVPQFRGRREGRSAGVSA